MVFQNILLSKKNPPPWAIFFYHGPQHLSAILLAPLCIPKCPFNEHAGHSLNKEYGQLKSTFQFWIIKLTERKIFLTLVTYFFLEIQKKSWTNWFNDTHVRILGLQIYPFNCNLPISKEVAWKFTLFDHDIKKNI